MTDIKLNKLWDSRNGFYIVIVQSMTGVYLQPQVIGILNTTANLRQVLQLLCLTGCIGVVAGMYFDIWCPGCFCGIKLAFIAIDKQGNQDIGFGQTLAGICHTTQITGHIEPAFGGQLFTLFRDETTKYRFNLFGNTEHFFGDGHFQIESGINRLRQQGNVAVFNVATVFPQMHGDAVCACAFCYIRSMHRIGLRGTTRISQRSDMININAKQNIFHSQGPGLHYKLKWRVL